MPIVVSLRMATKAATRSSQMTRMLFGSTPDWGRARMAPVSVDVMGLLEKKGGAADSAQT
ncbi:hypothetical protein GCM10022219_03340 [Microbacterium oryzae]